MHSISVRACGVIVAAAWGAVACGVSGQQPAVSATPASQVATPPETRTPSVVCLATVDGNVRLYRLHRSTPGADGVAEWHLTMTEPASKAAPVDVPLPGAVAAVLADNARLSYRSASGVTVQLDTSADGARLDVSVRPGAERDGAGLLPPGSERIDTGGAVRLPPCRIDAP